MSFEDDEYYRRRARVERERAANAQSFGAARAHQEMALRYERLLAEADFQPRTFAAAANFNGR